MSKSVRPEFYYDEKKQMYRKRFKAADGRYHDAYGKTKAETREARARMEEDIIKYINEHPPAPAESDELYVYQYAVKWFRLNCADKKPCTVEGYRLYINNYICPVIGQMPLKDVKRDDILEVMSAISDKSHSLNIEVLSCLRRIFAAAEDSDLIDKSPVKNIKAGGVQTQKKTALTREQQRSLIDAVIGTKAEGFVRLCLFAGLRREEALGLCWDCVFLDVEIPYIDIRRAVNWSPRTGKPELVNVLKSAAAYRLIPIPAELVLWLRSVRPEDPAASGPVICNSSGEIMSKQSFRRMWEVITVRTVREGEAVGEKVKNHKIVRSLDFYVTPHILRHTYVTELVMSGANLKTIQYLAGHANANISLEIYAHLVDHSPSATVSAVNGAFGG